MNVVCRVTGIAFAMAACGRLHFDDASHDAGTPSGWLPGFAHRKEIVFHSPVLATLDDFPAGFVETSDADLAASARADGMDLVFTDADGVSPIGYEVVSYDPASGAIEAWVRTQLHPAALVYLYYGGPAQAGHAMSAFAPEVAGAWHMGVTGAGQVTDATGGGHDTTQANPALVPASGAGVAGAGAIYDGVDDTLPVVSSTDGSLDFGTTSFTYELWVNVTTTVGPSDIPLHKGGSSTAFPGYDLELGTGPWIFGLSDGTILDQGTFGTVADFTGRWVHLACVVDRTANLASGYADGTLAQQVDISALGSIDSGLALEIGRNVNVFEGGIDEVRITRRALPPEWFVAETANFDAPASFLTVSAEQSP
jgi:hypothetical protein